MNAKILVLYMFRERIILKKSGQDRPSKILTPTAEKRGAITGHAESVETSDQKRGVGFSKKSKKSTLKSKNGALAAVGARFLKKMRSLRKTGQARNGPVVVLLI